MNKILIVDSDPSARKVLSNFLQKKGYTTLECHNITCALRILLTSKVGLIIMDDGVAGISRFNALSIIDGARRKIPLIRLTEPLKGRSKMEKVKKNSNNNYVIQKPFSLSQIEFIAKDVFKKNELIFLSVNSNQ